VQNSQHSNIQITQTHDPSMVLIIVVQQVGNSSTRCTTCKQLSSIHAQIVQLVRWLPDQNPTSCCVEMLGCSEIIQTSRSKQRPNMRNFNHASRDWNGTTARLETSLKSWQRTASQRASEPASDRLAHIGPLQVFDRSTSSAECGIDACRRLTRMYNMRCI